MNFFQGIILVLLVMVMSCKKTVASKEEHTINKRETIEKGTFGYDKAFLQKHYKKTIVLESEDKKAMVILSPELQGRVMTSSLNGDKGMSFGWINHDLIASKEISEQFNAFGGEERFWLGPEGGQFSVYFPKGAGFDFKDWKVPAVIDSEPFEVVSKNATSASFKKQTELVNYSGSKFSLDINRTITLLTKDDIKESLKISNEDFSVVAYSSKNTVTNIGKNNWSEDTGAVSIWILCMLNPSPEVTVVVPIKEGEIADLGIPVNDNYFGKVSEDRLKVTDKAVFFKADGKSRGKIGFSPKRVTQYIGSYDAINEVLTILEIDVPIATNKYVNSAWEIQEKPFSGDVFNSYNDGPLKDGTQMGPFYELESSSPALFLASGESYTHTQCIYHFKGKREVLDEISKAILKVSINTIQNQFLK